MFCFCCHTELPQTWWLSTTQLLQFRSSEIWHGSHRANIRCHQSCAPSGSSRGQSVLLLKQVAVRTQSLAVTGLRSPVLAGCQLRSFPGSRGHLHSSTPGPLPYLQGQQQLSIPTLTPPLPLSSMHGPAWPLRRQSAFGAHGIMVLSPP